MHAALVERSSRLELKITARMRHVTKKFADPNSRKQGNLEDTFPFCPSGRPCPVIGRFKFICACSLE